VKVSNPPGEAIRGPSRSLTALDPEPTAQTDPEPTFVSSPADRWVCRGAVIRTTRIRSSRQLVEQRLCLFQIGGIKALGEPAVNRREQIAGFGPPPLIAAEPGEARGGA
jgi:hypothetical protein